jgi:hypothetical protein
MLAGKATDFFDPFNDALCYRTVQFSSIIKHRMVTKNLTAFSVIGLVL